MEAVDSSMPSISKDEIRSRIRECAAMTWTYQAESSGEKKALKIARWYACDAANLLEEIERLEEPDAILDHARERVVKEAREQARAFENDEVMDMSALIDAIDWLESRNRA